MLHVVVLAAGKGTRMKSALPKVLHKVAGTRMIDYVLSASASLAPASTTVVVGHQADTLKGALAAVPGLGFVVQEPQLGTAHALLTSEAALAGQTGTLVMLSGDVPLLRASTLQALVAHHASTGAAATVLTADVARPFGYGRIVRAHGDGAIIRIVEEKDATAEEREITEINSGIYAFELDGLFETVRSISSANAQGEYYLPDLVAMYRKQGRRVETVVVSNPDEIRGINSRAEMAEAAAIVRQTTIDALMAAGVTIEDPATTYIGREVTIGPDTIIHPMVTLEGRTAIGSGCEIRSGTRIVDSTVADGATVLDWCLVSESQIGEGASVGPFAHLRNRADAQAHTKIGNFVELKKTVLGPGSKASHLAYLGDAVIGAKVNIGAGTITCNYDGTRKHQTTIEDGAFIGSDSQLIAPVTIGKGAYVGSGSTIRSDVPEKSLAVSAGKQRNIDGWVDRKKRG